VTNVARSQRGLDRRGPRGLDRRESRGPASRARIHLLWSARGAICQL